MSYEKKTWVNGETITADGLNNMESGIEAANASGTIPTLTVTFTNGGDTITIPKAEIDYIAANYPVMIKKIDIEEGYDPIVAYYPLVMGESLDSSGVVYATMAESSPSIVLEAILSITSSDVYYDGKLMTLSGDNYVYDAS